MAAITWVTGPASAEYAMDAEMTDQEAHTKGAHGIDPHVVAAALERHKAEPNITPDQHIRRLMVELGTAIAGRQKIYLDTRYWIHLRDAAMHRSRRSIHKSLLQDLRNLVASGTACCPVSDVILLELLKQSDRVTRLATARLIDELSMGVALVREDQRVGTEFAHFFHELGAGADVHPIQHLVWTKACFVWGENYPVGTQVDAATERVVQKAFIDHLWSVSLEQMVRNVDVAFVGAMGNFDGTAQRLNDANRAHSEEVRTYRNVVLNELAGVLDLYKERLAGILAELYERREGRRLEMSKEEYGEAGQKMRTALINLFRLKPELMRKRAPTLYVQAKCHAAIRWDKRRNLTGNDLLDFHHASAGLGYCDALFTDNPLKILLSQRHVALPSELGRFVGADEVEVAEYVRGLRGNVG